MQLDDIYIQNINKFKRLTFIDNDFSHRVTIDTDLKFSYKNNMATLPNLVIVEIKESMGKEKSLISQIFRDLKIRKQRISKYCISTVFLDKKIKHNRFKRLLLKLNKLSIDN